MHGQKGGPYGDRSVTMFDPISHQCGECVGLLLPGMVHTGGGTV